MANNAKQAATSSSDKPKTVYTIGHSNFSLDEFLGRLKAHGIKQVLDIRSIPRSRHNPQFSQTLIKKSLEDNGIGYKYIPNLGGRRRGKGPSQNLGWQHPAFRNYADYMQTPDFDRGMEQAQELAGSKKSALMCAEAVPWRCHRSLVGDAMKVRGWKVLDIMNKSTVKEHQITPFAKVDGTTITYPAPKPGEKAVPHTHD